MHVCGRPVARRFRAVEALSVVVEQGGGGGKRALERAGGQFGLRNKKGSNGRRWREWSESLRKLRRVFHCCGTLEAWDGKASRRLSCRPIAEPWVALHTQNGDNTLQCATLGSLEDEECAGEASLRRICGRLSKTKAQDGGYVLILALLFTLGARLARSTVERPSRYTPVRRLSAMKSQDMQATAQPDHGTKYYKQRLRPASRSLPL